MALLSTPLFNKTSTRLYINNIWVPYNLLISRLQKEFTEHTRIKWQGKRCGSLFSSMNLALNSWNWLWLPRENPNQPSLVADMIGELRVDNGNCFSCIVLLSCQRMPGSHQSPPGNYPNGSGSSKPQERSYWLAAPPCPSCDLFFFFLIPLHPQKIECDWMSLANVARKVFWDQ